MARAYHRLALDWYDRGGLTPNRKKFRLYDRMYEAMQKQYGVYCDSGNSSQSCEDAVNFDNPLYNIFFQFEAFIN